MSHFGFYATRQFDVNIEHVGEVHRIQSLWLQDKRTQSRMSLLDVGCGGASGTAHILSLNDHIDAIGVDISLKSLERVRHDRMHVLCAELDGVSLPFKSNSFDIVVVDEVIEHLCNTDCVLREIRRVLVPGGTLLISTPNLASWFNRLMLLFGLLPAFAEVSYEKIYGRPGRDVVGHLRLFTFRALTEMLTDHGFVVRRARGTWFSALKGLTHHIDRVMSRFPRLAADIVIEAEST